MSIQRLIKALSCSINYKRKDPEDSQWYVIINVVKKIPSITSQAITCSKVCSFLCTCWRVEVLMSTLPGKTDHMSRINLL